MLADFIEQHRSSLHSRGILHKIKKMMENAENPLHNDILQPQTVFSQEASSTAMQHRLLLPQTGPYLQQVLEE